MSQTAPHTTAHLFPKPPPEGKYLDPHGYEYIIKFRNNIILANIILVCLILGGVVVTFVTLTSAGESIVVLLILVGFLGSVLMNAIASFVYSKKLYSHAESVAARNYNSERNVISALTDTRNQIRKANSSLEAQMKHLEEIKQANTIGDIIINGNQAPVIIASTIRESFNTISTSDPELALAVKVLGGYIEQAKNKQAAEYFDELHKNIASPAPNKTIIRALWEGLVSVLPGVSSLLDVAKKIATLF